MIRTWLLRWQPTLSTFVLTWAAIFAGCEIKIEQPESKQPTAIRVPAAQAAIIAAGEKSEPQQTQDKAADQPPPATPKPSATDSNQANPPKAHPPAANANDPSVKFRLNVHQAIERIGAEIRDALSLNKTLVVLLVEQTAPSSSLVERITTQTSPLVHNLCAVYPGQFEIAVIGYGNDVNFLTPAPTSDAGQIESALNAIKQTSGDKANVFAAFNAAIEKFLPYRSRGYEVIFVVAGNSSGDDPNLADPAIIALKRAAVPVYGIAPAIPFGLPSKNRGPQQAAAERRVESFAPERIQLALPGNQSAADLIDSGYGPFGLERICRMTRGKLFRIRNIEPPDWETDSAAGDIKPDLLAKYAPDYIDQDDYQRLLAANKCRQALHDAALLPPSAGLESVRTEFPKQQDEAALAKIITTAQKAAAIDDQPIQKLYDTLIAAEADRPKLTGARWQAGYDLAIGQALAAKARLDGYNAMLALLKQGKVFANPDSTRWILEPADEIAANSVLDKMAKKSRVYLERVVAEHPGTPWATIAKRELRFPAGWKLVEK
jgi:hypothetical protein